MFPVDRCRLARLVTLFLLAPTLAPAASAEWKQSVIYQFQGGTDGQSPVGALVFDQAGNLYGATADGGSSDCSPVAGCGTVFQLTPPVKNGDPWNETVLYTFKGLLYGDGDLPAGGLVMDGEGNLYGTTAYGGTGNCTLAGGAAGCGTVYELSPPSVSGGAWTETIIYSFPTAAEGYLPQGDLVFDSQGNLYGATEFGGGYGNTCDEFYPNCGTVFELSPPEKQGGVWTEQVLHSFAGSGSYVVLGDGAMPNGGLVLDSVGNIYGTTSFGGYAGGSCRTIQEAGCGTVFELLRPANRSDAWTEKVIHRFEGADGDIPVAGVALDQAGNLYGTASEQGELSNGLIFELEKPSEEGDPWTEDILYELQGDEGESPIAPVMLGHGGIYTTTSLGGVSEGGTLLKLTRGASAQARATVLYSFPHTEQDPGAKLVWHNGAIYSTTAEGGGNEQNCGNYYGCGVVFDSWP